METEYLVYFKKIAETENMSKAAKLLNISQPSLSRVIKRLEEDFGSPLFIRNGKSLKLNDSGIILLDYTNQILSLMNRAASEIHSICNAQQTISLNMLHCNQLFPSLLTDFTNSHPNIVINLTRYESDLKSTSNCDISIHTSSKLTETHTSHKLMEEECLIGVSSKHPFAELDEIPLDLINKEKFIILNKENSLGELTLQFFKSSGIHPQIAMECDNQSSISSFVSLNLGIALFPSATWISNSSSIVYKRIKGYQITRSIYISSILEPCSLAANVFINYALEYLKSHQ